MNFEQPSALIPLFVDERVVALIAIFATLEQKSSFNQLDVELFRLLEQHAAKALVAAALFEAAERKLPELSAFSDLNIS